MSTGALADLGRVLGSYSSGKPGPLMIVVGGIHGNEPSGIEAAQRVLAMLSELQPEIAGRLVALVGHVRALRKRVRYFDTDLNRAWSEDAVRRLVGSDGSTDSYEQAEQRELLASIDEAVRTHEPGQRVVLLDLHSTSGEGPPFVIIGDTLQNRRIAFSFDVPVILGLEESIEGTLIEFFGNRGHTAVVLEGGQHDAPTTVAHHEAAIWRTLEGAGMLAADLVPGREEHRSTLAEAGASLPRIVEIRHRHGLQPDEPFEMEPGFANFDSVRAGQRLARSGPGLAQDVTAPTDGILLLPRYQGQGLDGFFLGRRVRAFWLSVSAGMRYLNLQRFVGWLPGVERRHGRPESMVVDTRVARRFAVELFHLLGYRRRRREGRKLIFIRRIEGGRTG